MSDTSFVAGEAKPVEPVEIEPPAEPRPKRPRKTLRVRMFFVGLLGGATLFLLLAARFLPITYEGTAHFERAKTAASEDLKCEIGSFESTRETLESELKSPDLVEKVIEEDLGLIRGSHYPRDPDGRLTEEGDICKRRLIEEIRQKLTVTPYVRTSTVDRIAVSYQDGDRQLAWKLPNAVVNSYIAKASSDSRRNLQDSHTFLESQTLKSRQAYEEANRDRMAFLIDPENVGLMLDRPGGLEEEIHKVQYNIKILQKERTEATEDIARLEQQRKQLEEKEKAETQPEKEAVTRPAGRASDPSNPASDLLGDAPQRIPARVIEIEQPNPRREGIEVRLHEAEDTLVRIIDVLGTKESQPVLESQRRRIAQLERLLKDTPVTVLEKTYIYEREPEQVPALKSVTTAQISMAVAQRRAFVGMRDRELRTLELELGELKRAREKLPAARVAMERLEKMVMERGEELAVWQACLRDVQMALDAEAAKKRIVMQTLELAKEPYRPVSPTISRVLLMPGVAGLVAGIVLAVLPIRMGGLGRGLMTVLLLVLLLTTIAATIPTVARLSPHVPQELQNERWPILDRLNL